MIILLSSGCENKDYSHIDVDTDGDGCYPVCPIPAFSNPARAVFQCDEQLQGL
jgi:hypothetical protein